MMKKDTVIALLSAVLALGAFLSFTSLHKALDVYQQTTQSTRTLKQAKQAFNAKKEQVRRSAYESMKQSGNDRLKAIAEHQLDEGTLAGVSVKFFDNAFTYNDAKSYLNRRKLDAMYATPHILNDALLFGNGSKTSAEAVKTMNATSDMTSADVFMDNSDGGDSINGTVLVQYSVSANGTENKGFKAYNVRYGMNSGKLVSVSRIE